MKKIIYHSILFEIRFSDDDSFMVGKMHPFLSVVVLYENIIVVLNDPVYAIPVPTITDTQIL